MNPTENFVAEVKMEAADGGVHEATRIMLQPLKNSPPRSLELSRWYKGLSDREREFVRDAMTEAVGLALFGLFGVIDGVVVLRGFEKGRFELAFVKDGERTILTGNCFLHDVFRNLMYPS